MKRSLVGTYKFSTWFIDIFKLESGRFEAEAKKRKASKIVYQAWFSYDSRKQALNETKCLLKRLGRN